MTSMKRRLLSIAMALQMLTFSGCKSVNNSNDGVNATTREKGKHMVLQVNKKNSISGSNEKVGLKAPDGYKILDFDYDFYNAIYTEFRDYVFVNKEDVIIKNPNNIGMPSDKNSKNNSSTGIYNSDEHVIADIKRNVNILAGKLDEVIELEAPLGYSVVDYDYDKTEYFEFENITYKNDVPVKVSNINEFGEPIDDYVNKNHNNIYYGIGEHKLVTIKGDVNFLSGKSEMKELAAPKGYKIVDYDYDKTPYFEFETVVYENIVPIIKTEKGFGKPIKDIVISKNDDNEYEIGEHVLAKINKVVNIGFGFEGTQELTAPDGYELLDYDYDKNEYFEFETFVYVNNKKVIAENIDNFGRLVDKEKTLVKKY